MSQVFYSAIDLQGELAYNSAFLQTDINSDVDSSYTWSNLIQGRYQFSVVAFTSKGPGKAASFMLSVVFTLPDNGMLVASYLMPIEFC